MHRWFRLTGISLICIQASITTVLRLVHLPQHRIFCPGPMPEWSIRLIMYCQILFLEQHTLYMSAPKMKPDYKVNLRATGRFYWKNHLQRQVYLKTNCTWVFILNRQVITCILSETGIMQRFNWWIYRENWYVN